MTKDLDGKTALVTGGGRGIGRAIAERLAAASAHVAIIYASNAATAEDTVRGIESAGGKAFAIQGVIGEPAAIEALAAKISAAFTERFGNDGIDILINNIGGGDYATIASTDAALLDKHISNNLRGPFLFTREIMPRLRDNGRVINISSAASRLAGQTFAPYSIAKAGLEMFTLILAKDLGPRGITVNSVAPGFTAVETNAEILENPAMLEQVIAQTALRRFGQASEIADFVYALASPLGRWITAQNIEASGGFQL